tara:strand:- start:451 stop:1194 length:744 start_codon:yes stop_codon:yes gene_type:complete
MDIPFSDVEPKLKIKKTHFTCPKCGKVFRKEDKFNEHVRKQLCIKKENRTYCEICDMVFATRKEYLKHLISPLHYNNLKKMEIEEFEMPNDEKTEIDPYLNKKDRTKMKQSYGDGISICFNNSDLLDIQFDEEEEKHVEEKKEEKEDDKQGFVISDRQKKIIAFLKKMENLPDNDKKFLQSLSKLNLDDYNGLITAIISEENLSIKCKQKYIQALKVFKQLLEKKLEEGTQLYNSIQITDIINLLVF